MNQTHLHLLINHLPVFGSFLGALVLAHGIYTRSNPAKIAAYNVLVISAIGAVIAYLTGEAAEETVENIAGISHDLIEEHEDGAVYSLIALIVAGSSSLLGVFLTLRKSVYVRKVAMATLLISFASFCIIARTAYIGGLIRHTEISNAPIISQPAEDTELDYREVD